MEVTHQNLISAARGYRSCLGKNLTSTLVVLPMYHLYGFSVCTLLPLVQGMLVVVLRKFEARTVLGTIQKYRITHMASVPPMVKAIMNLDEMQKFDLRSWVQIACGAAPLGPETVEAFAEKLPSVKFKQVSSLYPILACDAVGNIEDP